jgi:hypothetical protein
VVRAVARSQVSSTGLALVRRGLPTRRAPPVSCPTSTDRRRRVALRPCPAAHTALEADDHGQRAKFSASNSSTRFEVSKRAEVIAPNQCERVCCGDDEISPQTRLASAARTWLNEIEQTDLAVSTGQPPNGTVITGQARIWAKDDAGIIRARDGTSSHG